MDFERLRHKGWSEVEIAHIRGVLGVGATRFDHLLMWLLIVLLSFGGIGIAMLMLPIVLFANMLSIPISLLLGVCFGLMLTHTLRSLRIERKHHVRAFLFLVCISFISTLVSITMLQRRFQIFGGDPSAFIICIPLIIGMIIPYIAERRIHATA
jgi:hypothetical protein